MMTFGKVMIIQVGCRGKCGHMLGNAQGQEFLEGGEKEECAIKWVLDRRGRKRGRKDDVQ